jgi:hypothetical protein
MIVRSVFGRGIRAPMSSSASGILRRRAGAFDPAWQIQRLSLIARPSILAAGCSIRCVTEPAVTAPGGLRASVGQAWAPQVGVVARGRSLR